VLVHDLVTRHKLYWQTVVGTLGIAALFLRADAVSGTAVVGRLLGWVVTGEVGLPAG
jgi:hypothetical protein